jgi:hypothetical protein
MVTDPRPRSTVNPGSVTALATKLTVMNRRHTGPAGLFHGQLCLALLPGAKRGSDPLPCLRGQGRVVALRGWNVTPAAVKVR